MAAPEVMEMERVEPAPPPIDVQRIRGDFPILRREIRGKPLVYFDNAATTQKPRAVIDAIRRFYEEDYANIHRGVHLLERNRHRSLRRQPVARPAFPERFAPS